MWFFQWGHSSLSLLFLSIVVQNIPQICCWGLFIVWELFWARARPLDFPIIFYCWCCDDSKTKQIYWSNESRDIKSAMNLVQSIHAFRAETLILTFDDICSVLLLMHVYHNSVWVLLMLLYLLLMLDHVDVFHNVCIRGGNLLWIHRLLGRMLCLLQVHFLILGSRCLRCFLLKVLLRGQSWLASSFALTCPTDCNCGLRMSMATGKLSFRSSCYSQSLSVLVVRPYSMAHVVVHFSWWLRLVLRMGEVSACVLSTFVQLLWTYSRVTLIVGCQGARLMWWYDFTLFEYLTRFF